MNDLVMFHAPANKAIVPLKPLNFVTHNETDIDINGMSVQGYISLTYDQIVQMFGEPTEGDGYKTDAEWEVRFDNGVSAILYNWKDGHNYCGSAGLPVEIITSWNIGGFSKEAVYMMNLLFKGV